MTSATAAYDESLHTLRSAYLRRLPDQVGALLSAVPSAAVDDDRPHLESIHRVAHALAGSGATFGLRNLSQRARELAELSWRARGGPAPWPEIRAAIARLASAANENPGERLRTPARGPLASEARSVFVVDDDPARAADMVTQLSHFGFLPRVFPDLGPVALALAGAPPLAVLADAAIADTVGPLARAAAVPLVLLSSDGEVAERLRAVRAGGAAYFTRPANMPALVEVLETRAVETAPQPLRVLIVDDDEALAAAYAVDLRRAGMMVGTVSDPMRIMAALAELRPEVVLMDMFLPNCTGAELATVIRQEPAWVGVPILFLSSERDRKRQLAALRAGGDDFLTKPIEPERLISEITTRALRMRGLQARLFHDGLTGLLNHAAVRQELEREVSRARRERSSLSIAMLDLDGFKQINDTYGHPAGDRVLKSLSSMMRRRLRRSDLLGRYGGEEMLVILPATPAAGAVLAMDSLREAFAQVRHGAQEFFATFSVGVAELAEGDDPGSLVDAADRALYQAKRSGKNRVCRAS